MVTTRLLSLPFSCAALALAIFVNADADAREQRGHRQIPSWYLALHGGVSFVDDADVTDSAGTFDGTQEFDNGYGLGAAIGYRPRYTNSLADNLRFELELGVMDSEIDNFTLNSGGTQAIDGDVQAVRLIANGFIDFNLTEQLRPYIGGGLGAARIDVENDEDTVFAYQGMAGIFYTPTSFPVAEFGLGYRYFGTSDPTFTDPATGTRLDMEYNAHSLEAGVRLYF